MSKKNHISLSRRQVLGGVASVGTVLAGVGVGTMALFSDQESLTENELTAGTLNLRVSASIVEASSYYTADGDGPTVVDSIGTADGAVVTGVQITDIKPGDWIIVCFEITVEDNPGYVQVSTDNFTQFENGQTEPEAAVDTSTGGSLGQPLDGRGQGELQDNLLVELYDTYDDSSGSNPPRSYLNSNNELLSGTAQQVLGKLLNGAVLTKNGSPLELGPENSPLKPYLLFELPKTVGNEVQSDAIRFDLIFKTEQARNNDLGPNWIQTAKITSTDPTSGSFFGSSVDLHDSTIAIGADGNDDNGENAGVVYVFDESSGWTQPTQLSASDGGDNDLFGESVAVASDLVVVGAPGNEHGTGPNAGATYVFNRTNTGWQETKLTATGAGGGASFGQNVVTNGETIAVGADGVQQSNQDEAGAVYIFEPSGNEWTRAAVLTPNNSNAQDYFGVRTELNSEGDRLAVSAYGNDRQGENAGIVYLFEDAGGWTQTAALTASDGTANDYFGSDISMYSDTLAVGAFGRDAVGQESGAAYIFESMQNGWEQTAKITPSDGSAQEFFGWTTAIHNDTLLIGAYRDDTRASGAGAAYIYQRNNGTWTEITKLTAADADEFDRFGVAGDIGNNRVVITATGDEAAGPDTGAAYIFQQ